MPASRVLQMVHRFSPMRPQMIVKRRITVIGAALALFAGVVAADAQGIGYGPGVNPSNPQDLSSRSNPQDLSAPGGSNRQDLVRRPMGANVAPLASPSQTYAQRYTAKTRSKQKTRSRGTAGRR
jgi:hypothetical protein